MNTIKRLQLRANYNLTEGLLDPDGIYGKKSARQFIPSYLPNFERRDYLLTNTHKLVVGKGKCSSFGGKDDNGDRMNGLANITSYENAACLCQRFPNLFEWSTLRHFMADLKNCNPFDFEPFGLSAFLNPNAFYCALPHNLKPWFTNNDLITLKIMNANKINLYALNVPVIDRGPASFTNRIIDLSPGLMSYLELETDDEVSLLWEV